MVRKPSGYWTDQRIFEDALRFTTRSQWAKDSPSAYRIAVVRKLLDQACQHMPKHNNQSNGERVILKLVQTLYPSAVTKTFKINNSKYPFIKRFELDIYIPSIKKAIEFDGHHWHGTGLYRSSWPSEMLSKYHEIKDEIFMHMGISVLHVNEMDFRKNPCAVQRKIEKFLKCEFNTTIEIISTETDTLGTKWHKESCRAEALKYNTIIEWVRNSKSSYHAALRKGWVEELSSHMIKNPTLQWTPEAVYLDALQHDRLMDWEKNSKSAYNKSIKYGIYKKCTAHMRKGR